MNLLRSLLPAILLALPLPCQGKIKDFRFDLKTLGGARITQEDFADNVLIVDFWGTWCPPCRAAIPKLVDLYAKYKHHGLEILGLNYERGGSAEQQIERVRQFAIKERIPYTLALGDQATQNQVPNFRGYPTLLMFRRGLKFDGMHVGFGPGDEAKLEKWIRGALGLDAQSGDLPAIEKAPGEEPAEPVGEVEEEDPAKLEVPEGKLFLPGNGDKGFDFEAEDIDGRPIRFSELRGAPVLLALTASWDQEAEPTARFLQRLHEQHPALQVIAAHLEMPRATEDKVAAIEKFRKAHDLGYRMFPAGLAFTRKIHRFAGIPLLLVFDAEGTLVLREMGFSGEIQERVADKVRALAGPPKPPEKKGGGPR